jgi:TPR repeat protein
MPTVQETQVVLSTRNYNEAMKWFRKAADHGDAVLAHHALR